MTAGHSIVQRLFSWIVTNAKLNFNYSKIDWHLCLPFFGGYKRLKKRKLQLNSITY